MFVYRNIQLGARRPEPDLQDICQIESQSTSVPIYSVPTGSTHRPGHFWEQCQEFPARETTHSDLHKRQAYE